ARRIPLVITGQETAYTLRLRELAARLGLHDRVHFIGLAGEDELAALYAHAACYVYPSPEEDFGMGVVEAMAAAVPVVAWDHAGPTGTMVDGLTGYLVPPGSPELFAKRIVQLLDDEQLSRRLGRGAQSHALRHFTLDHHLEALENVLDDVCEVERGASRVVRGDVARLPFVDRSVDAVVFFDVLEHVSHPDVLLAEAARVLRPGGRLHGFVPCEGSLYTLHGLASRLGYSPKERYAGHIQRLTPGSLTSLLRRAALRPTGRRWSGHYFTQLI